MLAGPPGGDDRLLRIATTIQDVGAAAGTSPPNPPAARSRAGSE
jgi:hypothetical protein